MVKKVPFPINTDTSCLLKWNWSAIRIPEGTTNSCHRNWRVPFEPEEFDNFHNLPYKIAHRESMLRGEWPESPNHLGCGYCKNIEDSGGRSDRQFMNTTQFDQTPPELIEDPTATHVTPKVLEIFITNKCNMACTYCNRSCSSKIDAESKKFDKDVDLGEFFGKNFTVHQIEKQRRYIDASLKWLRQHGHNLRRFHILGGEPFYQSEMEEYLRVLEETNNPEMILNVVSNMNVKPYIFKKGIDRIEELVISGKIERFDLTASIDCWGPAQEYVRTGFNCDVTEENMRYALSKPITVHINSTHSLMSLDSYCDLLDKKCKLEDEFGKNIAMFGMTVSGDHIVPIMFGGDFFAETIAEIREKHPMRHWDDEQAFTSVGGILKSIEKVAEPNMEMIKKFLRVYNELDRRRGTDWKSTFPRIRAEAERYFPTLEV